MCTDTAGRRDRVNSSYGRRGAARAVLIVNLQVGSCIKYVRLMYAVNSLSYGCDLRTMTERWSSSITIN